MSDEMPPEEMPKVVYVEPERDGRQNIVDMECADFEHEFRESHKYLRADLAGPQWRDIENNPPKHETLAIVACILEHGRPIWVTYAKWSDHLNNFWDCINISGLDRPTHWMPLPDPPE